MTLPERTMRSCRATLQSPPDHRPAAENTATGRPFHEERERLWDTSDVWPRCSTSCWSAMP